MASESLASITDNVHSMSLIIHKISDAVTSQNQQAETMNHNLADIRQITEGTSESSQQMNNITQELNQLTRQLQTLSGQFKV